MRSRGNRIQNTWGIVWSMRLIQQWNRVVYIAMKKDELNGTGGSTCINISTEDSRNPYTVKWRRQRRGPPIIYRPL